MKKFITVMTAVVMAFIMAFINPVQTFASNADSAVYISEFKVGMGKNASTAEAALEGYTIITDGNGNKVDFNDNAGGGWGSKGEKVVFIGYKTTSNRSEAVTDIGLMNMKGGYKIEDYDSLMEDYLNIQIIPFVDKFMAAVREYRENYHSSNPANQERAAYIHDVLNKFTDDDCKDAPLGDLLLNETKYEMGDEAYNALSDAEKAKHADIVTIVAQANGMATLTIENLLVRASDTEETTWIERLSETTYDDLLEGTGLSLSKAKKELDKLYNDDAMRILDMWDTFKEQLENYDEASARLDELQNKDLSALKATIENFNLETATDEQSKAYGEAVAELKVHSEELTNVIADVMCKEYLESIDYEDGTLLDFFTMTSEEIDEDISVIYPMVASLSEGQRAGLDFLTMEDLVVLGATDENGYKEAAYDELLPTSIYENVDRGIYAKGGVGLTSDAIRTRALEELAQKQDNPYLSTLSYVMMGVTAACFAAFCTTLGFAIQTSRAMSSMAANVSSLTAQLAETQSQIAFMNNQLAVAAEKGMIEAGRNYGRVMMNLSSSASDTTVELASATDNLARMSSKSTTCSRLATGVGVVVILLIAFTTYLSYRDMVNHYKVEFTPIPRYMVDEKDITAFNSRGEKIVIKNQAAYYRAVTCNRNDKDEFYNTLGDIADLNGDVGQQWLAMYCARNDAEAPILADSLKVVAGNSQIPAGYSKGAHMFGTDAAENINNTLYIWNSGAKSIYLYYKQAEAIIPSLAGSGFSGGVVALSAGAGLGVGALASGLLVNAFSKRKKKEEQE